MKFSTKKFNGETFVRWDAIKAYLDKQKDGTKLMWEIRKAIKTISDPMRNYYFGFVLPPLMEDIGYERRETELFHHQMKIEFFNLNPPIGKGPDQYGLYPDMPSVFGKNSDISIEVKKEFVDSIVRIASERGVYIPDPGEK